MFSKRSPAVNGGAVPAKHLTSMLANMWMVQLVAELFGSARAARNAASELEAHRMALAEVDSVVARLQPHTAVPTAA